MAAIQTRTPVDGDGGQRTSYRVQIRRRGFPPVTATFGRKTDATKWAQATEADMDRRRDFPQPMSGASVPELAAVLGHRTLQMVKRYAHLSDQHTGEFVERMTRKYFG